MIKSNIVRQPVSGYRQLSAKLHTGKDTSVSVMLGIDRLPSSSQHLGNGLGGKFEDRNANMQSHRCQKYWTVCISLKRNRHPSVQAFIAESLCVIIVLLAQMKDFMRDLAMTASLLPSICPCWNTVSIPSQLSADFGAGNL